VAFCEYVAVGVERLVADFLACFEHDVVKRAVLHDRSRGEFRECTDALCKFFDAHRHPEHGVAQFTLGEFVTATGRHSLSPDTVLLVDWRSSSVTGAPVYRCAFRDHVTLPLPEPETTLDWFDPQVSMATLFTWHGGGGGGGDDDDDDDDDATTTVTTSATAEVLRAAGPLHDFFAHASVDITGEEVMWPRAMGICTALRIENTSGECVTVMRHQRVCVSG